AAVAGLLGSVIRGLSQPRPGQHAAAPGRARGDAPGTRHAAAAAGMGAHAGPAAGLACAPASLAVRIPAAGRTLARAAIHRQAGRPDRAHAGRTGAGGRCAVARGVLNMAASVAIDRAGQRLVALPERALWWPARHVLFIADPHFGKAAAFRAHGLPVPSGTTAATLGRLDGLLQAHPAKQLVVLGDFLHARAARAPAVLDALRQWRARWPRLHCTLVRGNHDSHAG